MTKTGTLKRKQKKTINYCKICDKNVFGGSSRFKAHLFTHNAIQEKYNCDYCLKKFYRKDAYDVHVNRHTKQKLQKSYICNYCEKGFIIKNNLITHLRRIHDEDLNSELGKFWCTVCNLSYCEGRLLDQHIRREHFNMQTSKEPLHIKKNINDTWIENIKNKNSVVSMTKVNMNVIVIKQLKIQVKVNKAETNVRKFKLESSDQYSEGICDYCKKKMLKKSLRLHIKEVHMNIRKFTCKVCKVNFYRHYQLVRHNCGTRRRRYKRI